MDGDQDCGARTKLLDEILELVRDVISTVGVVLTTDDIS